MESLPINITDLIVVAILLISGILAFFRGLVHEVLSVSAWIGAGFATLYGYPLLTPYIMKVISSELVAQIVSGVVVFIGVLIIISLISHGLSKRVKESALGALDRSLGFVFGLVRGAVLVCLCWLLLSWVLPAEERPEWVQEAKSLPLIEVGAEALAALVPEDIREESIEAVESARETTGEAVREKVQEEVDRQMEEMIAPRSNQENQDEGAKGDGYSESEREQLDTLIEGQQQQ
ncbi:CvpA family protein [Limibacillus halophilus]|jgi:membrane protein required for colicin V production